MAVTWNPSDKDSGLNLSSGNLKAETAAYNVREKSLRATTSYSSGKRYFEVALTQIYSNLHLRVGLADNTVLLSADIGDDANGWAWAKNGNVYTNNTATNISGSATTGDVIQVAWDADTGKLWFGKNGTWLNSGNPASGTNPSLSSVSGTLFPSASVYEYAESITACFAAGSFSYTPPSGFSAWEEASFTYAIDRTDITLDPVAPRVILDLLIESPSSSLFSTAIAPSWSIKYGYVLFEIPSPVIAIYSGGNVALTIPPPELDISGTVLSSGVSFTIPAPTLSIYGGGVARFTITAPTLTISGTTQQLARVEFEIPAPTLIATAKVGDLATVAFTIPAPVLSVFSGATVSLEIPALVLTATGTTTSLARVAFEIPAPTLTVTGQVSSVARVAFEIPAPILYVGRGNTVSFEIPAPLISIVAVHANTSAETTYAINLNTGAVTQLLLGGFDKLVTAHGRLYGLKNGALTRLEGDVDGTETLIPATIRFAPQTFNTNAVKRMSDVYWSTRESDGMTMELVADERTVWRYQTATDTAPAYGTHKIKTGRGIAFHTAGLTVRNRSGGALDIGGVELLVSPLSRKPK